MAIFEGKVILVTGGTGSFGGYFVNYLLNKNFKEIRVFSRDELKQEEMRLRFQNPKIKFYIEMSETGAVLMMLCQGWTMYFSCRIKVGAHLRVFSDAGYTN